ncbi:hypothetical protein BLNAU_10711 [Blattamonas nauphoetae]|uniref:Uncharacterized protein n=1 Tax=Blattamonas nauphoetae TaxID=2049346 RepID=A0ABQ9XRA8_9EUKA|nr:hypothetical protein BLNAU_10711 [Blattamonas nauphoetae]
MNEILTSQREWNTTRGDQRQMGKTLHRLLRMEGIDDVVEAKLRNDRNDFYGNWFVANSIQWSNLQALNLAQ